MLRILNFSVALSTATFGLTILYYLVPLILDPTAARAVLIDLPMQHNGLSPIAKITLFAGLVGLGIALAVWAGVSFTRLSSQAMGRKNLILLSQMALGFVMLECMMRVGASFDVRLLSNPTYLINPACGETYSRLMRSRETPTITEAYDAEVGWKRLPKPGNPDGLIWPFAIDERPKVWFFGDSFMAGVVAPRASVPAIFEAARPERQALNHSVSGYGVDQIWLRYRKASPNIPAGSPVFIGILPVDLDRSVLAYFWGYKPVFRRTDGRGDYELIPPPARNEIAALMIEGPDLPSSYGLAILNTMAELVMTGFDRSEATCDADEKRSVNAYLMDSIIRLAQERDHELRWVLFVAHPAFYKVVNWRYDFIKKFLDGRKQSYLDTRGALSRAAIMAGIPPEAFYIPLNGHLNARGNRVVAESLLKFVANAPTKSRERP